MFRSFIFILCACTTNLFAQAAPALDSTALIAQVTTRFSSTPIHRVQLTGTAQGYAGSDQPSGTFSYQIDADGKRTLRLDIGDLSRTDTAGTFGDFTACQHIDSAGVSRVTAEHNCSLPLDWILPEVGLQLEAAKLNVALAEASDASGATVHKLSFQRTPAKGSAFAIQMMKHLSHMDFAVDPTSMLLKSLRFTEHPEQDASTDFPVEVRYSDYRRINGVTLPFHIQKYVRGGLTLDLQAETAIIQ